MKQLFYCFLSVALLLSGCDDSDDPTVPSVALKQGTVTESEVTFTLTVADAEECAWLCLPSTDREPTNAEILEKGTRVTQSGETECRADGLKTETGYTVYAMARNNMESARASFSFNTPTVFADDVTMDYARGWYFGDFAAIGSGYFMVVLATMEIDNDGLPTDAGHMIRLFISSDKAADSNDAHLTDGTYLLTDGFTKNSVNATNSDYIVAYVTEEGLDGPLYALLEGTVQVGHTAAGDYDITAEIMTDENKRIRCSYTGPIVFANEDAASYVPLTEDYSFTPDALSGGFLDMGDYGNYTLTFHSLLLDEYGFVIGGGDLVNIELLTQPSDNGQMDFSVLPGTYGIANGDYRPGTFVEGMFVPFYGMYIPMGTYYELMDDEGGCVLLGLSVGGTVTISDEGDGYYKYVVDLLTEKNVHVRMEHTGKAADEIADIMGGMSMKQAARNSFRGKRINLLKQTRNRLWQAPFAGNFR